MLEKNLKNKLKRLWDGAHMTVIENSVSSGIPDLHVTMHGVKHWIELKRLYSNKYLQLRPLQAVWMTKELAAGYDTLILWSDHNMAIYVHWSVLSTWDYKIVGGKRKVTVNHNQQVFCEFSTLEKNLFQGVYSQ